MIGKECFTTEWIDKVSAELNYSDKNLIEKVIRALSLLEMLVESGCPLIFKGGTALMLLLGKTVHRLSIDIDIVCPPGTNIEKYLKPIEDYGFLKFEVVERKQRNNRVPKSHSKVFYQVAYLNDTDVQSYILLDVLYEDMYYTNTQQVAIDSPFIDVDGKPVMVVVPSIEDFLGDKLTSFAPNTTGVPYYKGDKSCSMEIIKQLYDVGRLFDCVSNLDVTSNTFMKLAEVELSYRGSDMDVTQVCEDIRQTALCVATRGKAGEGNFALLQEGIKKVKPFMYLGHYYIEDAIIDCSRAAYLATSIERGNNVIERYLGNPLEVRDMRLTPALTNKLNKLRINLPEAFFYWVKTSEML